MPHIAYIDTIDACHLKCPTCVRGVRVMENTSRKMPLDLFERVVAKIGAEGYSRIGLFSWNEPFLNQTLHDYVSVAKAAKLACDISTTLSLRRINHLEKVLRAGPDEIIVSMSGADQSTYERNHIGGNLSYALANLRLVREIIDRHQLPTIIRMRLIRFHYNAEAEKPLSEIAAGLRFRFETIPGGGNPDDNPSPLLLQTPAYFEREIARATKLPAIDQVSPHEVCPLIFDVLTIDCAGDVHLCCAFPNYPVLKIGPYLDMCSVVSAPCRGARPLKKIYLCSNQPVCRKRRLQGHNAPSELWQRYG